MTALSKLPQNYPQPTMGPTALTKFYFQKLFSPDFNYLAIFSLITGTYKSATMAPLFKLMILPPGLSHV